jgi:hypothetical protein
MVNDENHYGFFEKMVFALTFFQQLKVFYKRILQLSEKHFDKEGLLGLQAIYYDKDVYYPSYYEEISKEQFPFKKTIVFEHVIPPTLEEIDEANVPLPPVLR